LVESREIASRNVDDFDRKTDVLMMHIYGACA
jgi:hypothetical protein